MIKRQELEARALRALQSGSSATVRRCAEFSAGFAEELNRLRREPRARLAAAPRELAAINRRSKEILELPLQGFRDNACLGKKSYARLNDGEPNWRPPSRRPRPSPPYRRSTRT